MYFNAFTSVYDNNSSKGFSLLVIVLLMSVCYCQNWVANPYVQCGYTVVVQTNTSVGNYTTVTTTFANNFGHTPDVVLGIAGLEVYGISGQWGWTNKISSFSSSGFTNWIDIEVGIFYLAKISYLAIDSTAFPGHSVISYQEATIDSSFITNKLYQLYVSNAVSAGYVASQSTTIAGFITGFQGTFNQTPLDLAVTLSNYNSTHYLATLTMSTVNNFTKVAFYRLSFGNDNNNYAGTGVLTGQNGIQSNQISGVTASNLYIGLISFASPTQTLWYSFNQSTFAFQNSTFNSIFLNYFFILQCSSLGSCDCSVGYQPINSVCTEICGDGQLYVLPCDDGNTVSGDGCSSTCQIQSAYTCLLGGAATASVCSLNSVFSIANIQKDPYSNTFNLLINSLNSELISLNSVGFISNQSAISLISTTVQPNGQLLLRYSYNSSIDSSGNLMTLGLYSAALSMIASNNQRLYYYSDDTYSSQSTISSIMGYLQFAYLGILVISLYSSKLLGIELMGVIQITFWALILLTNVDPLIYPLSQIPKVNGYNGLGFYDDQNNQIPGRISLLGQKCLFLMDFNVMVIPMLCCLLVGLILLLISRLTLNEDRKAQLSKYGNICLKDMLLTTCLFSIYNIVMSFTLYFKYAKSLMLAHTIFGVVVMLMVLVNIVLFVTRFEDYQQYTQSFKSQKTLNSMHTLSIMLVRIVTSVLLALGVSWWFYIILSVRTLYLVYLLATRPCKNRYKNSLLILDEVIVLVILAIFTYLANSSDYQNSIWPYTRYFAFAIIALLILDLVINIPFIGYQFWLSCRRKQVEQMIETTKNDTMNKLDDTEMKYIEEVKQLKSAVSRRLPNDTDRSQRRKGVQKPY